MRRAPRLFRAGRIAECRRAAERVLATAPDHGAALNAIGNARRREGAIGRALSAYRAALVGSPASADAHSNLGMTLKDVGRMAPAAAALARACALAPDRPDIHGNLLLHLPRLDGLSPRRLFAVARAYDARFGGGAETDWRHLSADPERRLRVGYVGGLLARRQNISWQYGHLLTHRTAPAFDATLYTDWPPDQAVADELAASGARWRPTAGLGDPAVAQMIRDDRIDILVTPCTHLDTARTAVFALKPAPVQVDMGSMTSSGVSAIDYRLTDWALHPRDTAERFVERLVRLPHFFVFRPDHRGVLPPVAGGCPGDAVTFVASNRIDKVNDAVLDAWGRILTHLPAARLLIRAAPGRDSEIADWPRRALIARGVRKDQVVTFPHHADFEAYLKALGQADIMLDTFPFGGCNTLMDALLMGVVPVARAGALYAGRAAAGILPRVGLAHLVTRGTDDYVARAVELARAPATRVRLRAELRRRVRGSILCDVDRHARWVERFYRAAWRRWCAADVSRPAA
jgi:predicted O-linked N-acetylglucosamine transferase (SPINDLY family)